MPIARVDTELSKSEIMILASLLTDDELETCMKAPGVRTRGLRRPEPISLREAVNLYIIEKLNSRPLNTQISYRNTLNQFLEFNIRKMGYIPTVGEITPASIREFIKSLSGRRHGDRLEPRTQLRKLMTLKAFFRFLKDNKEMILVNPTKGVSTERIEQLLPVALSVEESEKMIELAGLTRNPERDQTILATFLFTGCRLQELVDLRVGDYDLKGKYIKFFGKGAKERQMPVLPRLEDYLIPYLNFTRKKDHPEESMFGISKENVQRIIKSLFKKMGYGVNDRRSTHSLRHSFAVMCLEGDINYEVLRQLLGHEHLTTTQEYTRLNLEQKRKILKEKFILK